MYKGNHIMKRKKSCWWKLSFNWMISPREWEDEEKKESTPKPVWALKGPSNRRITFPIGIARPGNTQFVLKLCTVVSHWEVVVYCPKQILIILRQKVSSASKQKSCNNFEKMQGIHLGRKSQQSSWAYNLWFFVCKAHFRSWNSCI